MRNRKKLPIGIDSFEKIIRHNFYYVDKTEMITELLHNWGEVNLFTRPRRFGKSLNMNMLQSFLEIGCDKSLFNGLKVSREKELCEEYMGKFPVISLTLKNVEGLNFESARKSLKNTLGMEAWRLSALAESSRLTEEEKNSYKALTVVDDHGDFKMSDATMEKALLILTVLLEKHYGKKAVLLIDEYDVPLDKAFQYGYYDEMVSLIRNMFGNVLKTNSSLFFAVLTGCLRIAKESIFTGLNNFNVFSITSVQFDEFFGFTDDEVAEMLKYFGLSDYHETIREWYDGYQFGKEEIYCPWDVLNYIREHIGDRNVPPKLYWINTSGNEIVKKLIRRADSGMRDEIEQLIEGKSITKEIHMEMTYKDLDDPREGEADTKKENLWSILYTTGYLTSKTPSSDGRHYNLEIPNKEIRAIFVMQVREWMSETVIYGNTDRLLNFCQAVKIGEVDKFQELFNEYLVETISIRDTGAPSNRKESFYHGLLLGLLRGQGKWKVRSNLESGTGYADIVVEIPQEKTGLVIEVKYAENGSLDSACKRAVEQIEKKQYETQLEQDGMETIYKYGIACYKKKCRVLRG
mgnify:CR=1 FL=1